MNHLLSTLSTRNLTILALATVVVASALSFTAHAQSGCEGYLDSNGACWISVVTENATLTANPGTIVDGDSSRLDWTTSGDAGYAMNCEIDWYYVGSMSFDGVIPIGRGVAAYDSGSVYVSPSRTAQYVLACNEYTVYAGAGPVQVTVIPGSSPPGCVSNKGQSCSSSGNACGQTQANGTIQCDGSCSSTPPANPGNLGQACTSSANSCGQTNAGTIQCDGSCSASAPADPAPNSVPSALSNYRCTGNFIEYLAGSPTTEDTDDSAANQESLLLQEAQGYANSTTCIQAHITKPAGAKANVPYTEGGYPYIESIARYSGTGTTFADPNDTSSGRYSLNWYGAATDSSVPSCSPAVNGACAVNHYSCSAGTIGNTQSSPSQWTWTCAGTNGGTTASCSESTGCGANTGASCTSTPNGCGQTNSGTIQCDGSCSATTPSNNSCAAPTVDIVPSPNPTAYSGTTDLTLSSTNANYCYVRVDWGENITPQPDTGYFTSGVWHVTGLTPGVHEAEAYCYNSVWAGSGWVQKSFTVSNPPTASVSVAPNPVNYGSSAALTLSSTNANYCYMRLDWGENITPQPDTGYFTSGTWYTPSNLSPGTHEAEVYCYNSVWYGSGWSVASFTVANPSIAGSCSASPSSGYLSDTYTWSTSGISGGNGSYTYSWSGDEGLSGSGASVQKTYSSYGTKNGSVTVSSGGLSQTISCSPSVVVNQCYGAGCGGGGCTNPSLCCSPTPGVCPAPPTATLSADAVDVNIGQATTLRWSCSGNASSFSGNSVIGSGAWPGRSSAATGALNSLGAQTYQMTCSGPGGTSQIASVTITVHGPSATISANPGRVSAAPNNQTRLTWLGTDVTSCVVSGPGVNVSGNASGGSFSTQSPKTVTITAQSKYTITCQTSGAPVTDSVIVNIPPGFTEF